MVKQNIKTALGFVGRFFVRTRRIWAFAFLALVLMFLYMPLIIVFAFSFTTGEIGTWNGFTLDLYLTFFRHEAARTAFLNTFLIAIIAAVIATVIGTMAAVGMFYLRKWRKKAVNTINQIPLTNATVVTGVSIMLLFLSLRFIPFGYVAIIIAHTMMCIPFVVLVVTPRMYQLNPNLLDAGMDLGLGPAKVMFKVLLPQLLPAIFAAFCLAFAISLDDFILTVFIRGEINTISTFIVTHGGYLRSPIQRRAFFRAIASVMFMMTIVAVILVYWYVQRRKRKLAKA
ncbi:MAG: ABC transporter permease [Firmicutes bacterium]|nr:ABC transporter permease [Bacillota bacterium]